MKTHKKVGKFIECWLITPEHEAFHGVLDILSVTRITPLQKTDFQYPNCYK